MPDRPRSPSLNVASTEPVERTGTSLRLSGHGTFTGQYLSLSGRDVRTLRPQETRRAPTSASYLSILSGL